jgi:hypothetical protein
MEGAASEAAQNLEALLVPQVASLVDSRKLEVKCASISQIETNPLIKLQEKGRQDLDST